MNHDEQTVYSLRECYELLLNKHYESFKEVVDYAEEHLTKNEFIDDNDEFLITRTGLQLLHCIKDKRSIAVY